MEILGLIPFLQFVAMKCSLPPPLPHLSSSYLPLIFLSSPSSPPAILIPTSLPLPPTLSPSSHSYPPSSLQTHPHPHPPFHPPSPPPPVFSCVFETSARNEKDLRPWSEFLEGGGTIQQAQDVVCALHMCFSTPSQFVRMKTKPEKKNMECKLRY